MNQAAQEHLTKAHDYIGQGNSFYAKAADEIIAAQKADSTLSHRQIAERLGCDASWVNRVVSWRTSDAAAASPFARAEGETARKDREAAARTVRTDPSVLVDLFTALPAEQQEMVAQEIAQQEEFAAAIKASPVARDELVGAMIGTPTEQHQRREEQDRQLISRHPLFGWSQVADGLGTANYGLTAALDALVRLAINARVDSADDALQVARLRAEKIGRSIHEIEMAWNETPITDKIEELRRDRVS